MSIEALNWANEQRCATPAAQFLLEKLAWWADPTGRIRFVDINYIEERTLISRSSIFRHLAEFREHGVFEAVKSIDDDGVVTYGGQMRLDRALRLERKTKGRGEPGEADATAARSESHHETGVSPCDSGERVSPCDSSESHGETRTYIRDLESKDSPLNPPDSSGGEEGLSREDRLAADWRRFTAVYPIDGTMDLEAAKRALGRLALKDRDKAIRWAKVYADAGRAKPRFKPIEPAVWLGQRRFDALAEVAGSSEGAPVRTPMVFVRRGTPWWDAWVAAGHSRTLYTCNSEGQEGWFFASQTPKPSASGAGPPARPSDDDFAGVVF